MWRDRFGRGFEPVVRLLDDDDDGEIDYNNILFITVN